MAYNNQQSKLENIFSYSFPANHLLQISIVKQISEQSYKKEFFCFITLAPGSQTQQGGRSFDFNNRITMKVDGHQVTALAHAVRAYVRGQDAMLGRFSIYVDSSKSAFGGQSGGSGKSMMVQRGETQKKEPAITFFFKQGQGQALGYSMSPAIALAAADVFEFIGKKCLELEFARGPVGNQIGAYENPNPTGFAEAPPTGLGPNTNQFIPNNTSSTTNQVADDFTKSFAGFDDIPF